MIFRALKNNPERMIPAAMALIVAGLSIIVVGVNWPRLSPVVPHQGTDWNDFFRGAIFGFGLVLEIAGVALAAKAAAMKKRNAEKAGKGDLPSAAKAELNLTYLRHD